MNKKVIAVDIDEVLADWYHFALPKLNKILNTSKTIEGVKHVPFGLEKFFGVSSKRIHYALDKMYQDSPITEILPVKGSQVAIEKLSKHFKLIAVTARPKKFWQETKDWVKQYFNGEIEVYLGTGQGSPSGGEDHEDDKMMICRKNKAIYIIEDNPSEILAFLNTSTTPLCMAWPWNKSLENNPNIIRGDWKKILKFILDPKELARTKINLCL